CQSFYGTMVAGSILLNSGDPCDGVGREAGEIRQRSAIRLEFVERGDGAARNGAAVIGEVAPVEDKLAVSALIEDRESRQASSGLDGAGPHLPQRIVG